MPVTFHCQDTVLFLLEDVRFGYICGTRHLWKKTDDIGEWIPRSVIFLITAQHKQALESGSGIYLMRAGQFAQSTGGTLSSVWEVGVHLLVMSHLESMRRHVFVTITSPLGPWLVSVSRLVWELMQGIRPSCVLHMCAPSPDVTRQNGNTYSEDMDQMCPPEANREIR